MAALQVLTFEKRGLLEELNIDAVCSECQTEITAMAPAFATGDAMDSSLYCFQDDQHILCVSCTLEFRRGVVDKAEQALAVARKQLQLVETSIRALTSQPF